MLLGIQEGTLRRQPKSSGGGPGYQHVNGTYSHGPNGEGGGVDGRSMRTEPWIFSHLNVRMLWHPARVEKE